MLLTLLSRLPASPRTKRDFMSPFQAEYFRQKLLRWRAELLKAKADGTLASLSCRAAFWNRTSPIAPVLKPIGHLNCAPATAPAN